MDAQQARSAWQHLESINAVTYFSPESHQAGRDLGLRGFWMAYFAFRAAPLGASVPGVVEATFYNFKASRVRRALPDAWSYATSDAVVRARQQAAAAALRRLCPDVDEVAARVRGPLAEVIARAGVPGRVLFAANRDLGLPEDDVEALWQAATTLREHRGDGHVALLASAELDGCEANVLHAATQGMPAEVLQATRDWSLDEWQAAVERLRVRGLLDGDGTPTDAGRDLRGQIEDRTDELAAPPYGPLDGDAMRDLIAELRRVSVPVMASGEVPRPNPMGHEPDQS